MRFAVFKRDAFTCQYCGHHAPHVKLEVDHKLALANGGKHEMSNFTTACHECNRGKGTMRSATAEWAAWEANADWGMDAEHLFFDGDPWLASFYGGICEG